MSAPHEGEDGEVMEDAKGVIAHRIFDALIHDALIQIALDTHQDEATRRRIAEEESQLDSTQPEEGEIDTKDKSATSPDPPTRPITSADTTGNNNGASSAPATSLLTSTYSSNPLIRCVLCNRHVASNRYAPHLAKCMGLGSAGGSKGSAGGLKRKAAVGAAAAAAAVAAANANGSSSGAGTPASSERGYGSGGGKGRGRPPKFGGGRDRLGTHSARSTPGYGGKEGSATL